MGSPEVTAGVVSALIAAGLTFGIIQLLNRLRKKDAESEAREIVASAEREAQNRRRESELEAKERTITAKADADKELNKARQEMHERERALDKRQDTIDQNYEQLRRQEKMVENNQRKLVEKTEEANRKNIELEAVLENQKRTLQSISGISREEATNRLLAALERDLQHDAGERVQQHERRMAETLETKTREILLTSIQRYASAHTADSTTSTVDIPSDEMKGRIIGREGRNIRAFEKASGVDVIIDDTPGVVIVSGFDPVRREVARMALSKLIADGRIHPARIEEVVAETQNEMEKHIEKAGENAAHEVGVAKLHPKAIYLLGRLQYRTSYSQNVLRHSVEVAFLAGMIAEELGLDGDLARRCGLLHDIGKAADHETEGGHPKIGADLLKRYGEGPEVVHAALGHHDDIRIDHPYTVAVAAADAVSASRPGARRESLDRYIKRMEDLEKIATSFEGVDQAFAIQAGREMRIIANAKNTTDQAAAKIGYDIARAYEQQLTYPGEIKVTVIRETRITEIAH